MDNHTIAVSKPPLLSVLSNYGSGSPAMPLYLSPMQTSYRPLLPIIDIISGQIFSTDPRGGLSLVIVRGEPRVFLPLDVHLGQDMTSWVQVPVVDTSARARRPSLGPSVGSPSSPTSPKTKRSSVFGWLGHKGGASMSMALRLIGKIDL